MKVEGEFPIPISQPAIVGEYREGSNLSRMARADVGRLNEEPVNESGPREGKQRRWRRPGPWRIGMSLLPAPGDRQQGSLP